MQYFIDEHHTGSPMAQLFVQPHHYRFSPFDQQQQQHLYYYDHRREATVAAAVLERNRLLIERQLALERERERQRRRAFLLRKIAQEERRQAELEVYYHQWQIKRQIEEQQEQEQQQQLRRKQQAELLEHQRRIELVERQRRYQQQQQQQQQQREHQERYANAVSMLLRQALEEKDEDHEMEEVEPEEQQQQQQQQLQERYAEAVALMARRFWKDDEEMVEPQSQQEPIPTAVANLASDTEKSKADCKSEIDQAQQHQQEEEEEQRQGNCNETNEHIQDGDSHRKENVPFVQDKKINESDAPHTESTEAQGPDQDDRMWEQVSTLSEDEGDDVDEKHERLRLVGDQLAQLSKKHASTLPMTRLQFQDDVSEVTATSADNRQFLGLEDEVMQVMLQLDSIQSGGSDAIRKERKTLIHKAEKLLESMDEHKQHEWERVSVHSTASEDEGNTA